MLTAHQGLNGARIIGDLLEAFPLMREADQTKRGKEKELAVELNETRPASHRRIAQYAITRDTNQSNERLLG